MNETRIISALQGRSDSGNVLMLLGIALFVILVIAFFVMVVRKQNVAVLLPFFILPIIMIGFTSISLFKGPGFEVQTLQQEINAVENNPYDEAAKKKLSASLQKAEQAVPINKASAKQAATIAAGHIALGQPIKAQQWASVAVKKDPNSKTARMVLERTKAIRSRNDPTGGPNP
jgi:ABC-type transport system involved in multi-copper enzyme maturation permease subunit